MPEWLAENSRFVSGHAFRHAVGRRNWFRLQPLGLAVWNQAMEKRGGARPKGAWLTDVVT